MFYEKFHALQEDYYRLGEGENLTYPIHLHFCYELILVRDGEICVRVDEEEYLMKKNDIMLIFPHQPHEFRTDHGSHHFTICFSGNMVDCFHKKRQGTLPKSNLLSLPEEIATSFYQLQNTKNLCFIKSVLYHICGMFDETIEFFPIPSRQAKSLLIRALEYIEDHYRGVCTLRAFSEWCSYDYAYLSRFFAAQTGMSFNECVNRRRIEDACFLLRSTERTVLEIGEACGFGTPCSFIRNFRKFCGISPSEFRQAQSEKVKFC